MTLRTRTFRCSYVARRTWISQNSVNQDLWCSKLSTLDVVTKRSNIPLHLSYYCLDSLLFENKYNTINLNCWWFIFLLKGCIPYKHAYKHVYNWQYFNRKQISPHQKRTDICQWCYQWCLIKSRQQLCCRKDGVLWCYPGRSARTEARKSKQSQE